MLSRKTLTAADKIGDIDGALINFETIQKPQFESDDVKKSVEKTMQSATI
jgi:hypothetical protein